MHKAAGNIPAALFYTLSDEVRPPRQGHVLRDARMGIPYRTKSVRPARGMYYGMPGWAYFIGQRRRHERETEKTICLLHAV